MKIFLYLLLAPLLTSAPLLGLPQASAPRGTATTSHASPDLALNELLIQVQGTAQKSDADVAVLRIDKWKTEAASKQQAQAYAGSVRKNLTNAIPTLLQGIQASPGSLNANFRLYRNLNVLYDTFSALVESAGAFGPKEQYETLATDIKQLDHLRREVAERIDMLAGANDAELARLRAKVAASAAGTKPASKVVVDDDQAKPKKRKAKTSQNPSQTPPK